MFVEDGRVRSRLISRREVGRLMGLPESYQLPENYSEAYHLAGDGVVVPVVRYLAKNILEPVLLADQPKEKGRSAEPCRWPNGLVARA
jgi:DNA (cytosine-5)-methyltransferase 1